MNGLISVSDKGWKRGWGHGKDSLDKLVKRGSLEKWHATETWINCVWGPGHT